jgi:Rieske Fe-S protein
MATGAMAVAGAFLAACGSDSAGSPTSPGNVNLTVTLANFPALGTVGGIAQVSSSGSPVAVVRASATTYRAFSMVCPHQGSTVSINGSGFRCPNHGATFNGNGAWTGGERTSGLFEFKVASNTSAGTITITS